MDQTLSEIGIGVTNYLPRFDEVVAGRFHESAVAVSLDKLIFTTNYPLDRDELKTRAKPAMRGDGHVIENLPKGRGATLFFADAFDDGLRFSLNPSRFDSAWTCLEAISATLKQPGLRSVVKEVDIALTFPCVFESLYMGLDFGFRRAIDHVEKSGKGQTVYIGKIGKKWEIKVYDKTKEMRAKARKSARTINFPCSRIEITWRPREEMRVEDLSRMLEVEPFLNCTAYGFQFLEPKKNVRRDVWKNFYEFEHTCRRWGFFHARKILNAKYPRNFSKKFGDFYLLDEMKPTLDEIYLEGIRGFFRQ